MSAVALLLKALLQAEPPQVDVSSDPNATRVATPDNAQRRATLAATALPILGRYSDDDGPLDASRPEYAPPRAVAQAPRRQRTRPIDPLDFRRPR